MGRGGPGDANCDRRGLTSAPSGHSSSAGRRDADTPCVRSAPCRTTLYAPLPSSQPLSIVRSPVSQAAELNFDKGRVATAKRIGWLDEPYPGVLVVAQGIAGSNA